MKQQFRNLSQVLFARAALLAQAELLARALFAVQSGMLEARTAYSSGLAYWLRALHLVLRKAIVCRRQSRRRKKLP